MASPAAWRRSRAACRGAAPRVRVGLSPDRRCRQRGIRPQQLQTPFEGTVGFPQRRIRGEVLFDQRQKFGLVDVRHEQPAPRPWSRSPLRSLAFHDSGSFSRRSRLATAAWPRPPTSSPASRCVKPPPCGFGSHNSCSSTAVSSTERGLRSVFSASMHWRASASSSSRTMQGMTGWPARLAARQRRSPATS